MAEKPETRFWRNKVKKRLEKIQETERIFFEKIQQVAIRGTPDVLICFRGWFVGWELKVPPNHVYAGSLQEFKLNKIHHAGGIAREVTPQNLDQRIEELLCLKQLSLPLESSYQDQPPLMLAQNYQKPRKQMAPSSLRLPKKEKLN